MKILISNGFTTAKIDFTGHDAATELTWVSKSIRLLDHLSITSSMQLIVRVPDLDPDVNITEGGLDYFFISNQNVAEQPELISGVLKAFPNPVSDQLNISGAKDSGSYFLSDLNGRIVKTGYYSESEFIIDLSELNSGCYILQIDQQVLRVLKD